MCELNSNCGMHWLLVKSVSYINLSKFILSTICDHILGNRTSVKIKLTP